MGIGGVSVAKLARKIDAQEREQMLADDGKHLGRRKMLEMRPAEVFVGTAFGVSACREDPPLHCFLKPIGLVLLKRMQVVESANKK